MGFTGHLRPPSYSLTISSPPTTQTCDGDGDSRIGYMNDPSSPLGTCDNAHPSPIFTRCLYESYLAWQHLSNAGLVDGHYSGQTDASNNMATGINVPASQVTGAGWTMLYVPSNSTTGDTYYWDDDDGRTGYGHTLMFTGQSHGALPVSADPVITPEEALYLDNKMDDGKPGTGKIRSWRIGVNVDCVTNDGTQTGMIYDTSKGQIACNLIFLTGF